MESGYRAIPQDGGNPTQVNDAIPAHATAGWSVGWLVGSLAYYTHYASSTLLSSPLSSSIKTFPLSLSLSHLSPFSQPSLAHSMGRSRMWVRVDGEAGRRRSVKECRDPGSPSLWRRERGEGGGERAILDNVICSIACSHGDGDRLGSCMTRVIFVDQG